MIKHVFMAVAIVAGLAVTTSETSAFGRKRGCKQPVVYSQPCQPVYGQPSDIFQTACGEAKDRVKNRYPDHNHHGFTACGFPNAAAAEAAAVLGQAEYVLNNPKCSADVVIGSEKVGFLNYVGFYVCKDIFVTKSKYEAK